MLICFRTNMKNILILTSLLIIVVGFCQNSTEKKEALLILPGFGSKIYGTRTLSKYFKKNAEMPVYIPKYISRKSIKASICNLEKYYKKHSLNQYESLHVMAYIVGSWTLNEWILDNGKRNIKTILYDRSPLQERAPTILLKDLPLINALVFGKVTKDFVSKPYPSMTDSTILTGMLIETYATNFIRKHKLSAMEQGPVSWEFSSLMQPVDHFTYLPLNHDQLYTLPQLFGADIFHFIKHGSFSSEIIKNRPVENPYIKLRKR